MHCHTWTMVLGLQTSLRHFSTYVMYAVTQRISLVSQHTNAFAFSLRSTERQTISNVLLLGDLVCHDSNQPALAVSVMQGTCADVGVAIPWLCLRSCMGQCSHTMKA